MERKISGAMPDASPCSIPGGAKDIRPEVLASDLVVGGVLDRGPPFRTKQSAAGDPVRDGSLLDRGAIEEAADCGSKSGLAPRNLYSSEQSGDVRRRFGSFHRTEDYTRILVSVNKNGCFQDNKDPCKVISMSAAKSKRAARVAEQVAVVAKKKRKKRKKPPTVGADGLTAKQRLHRLMEERGIGQTALARRCSEYYSAFVAGSDERFKQQNVGNFIANDQDTADWLVIAAKIFEVNCVWLQFGIGKKEIQ